MEFVQALQRRRSMHFNSYDYDRPNVFSYTKPSRVMSVYSEQPYTHSSGALRGYPEHSYTQPSEVVHVLSEPPHTQPSGVVRIHSGGQWKAYFDATKHNNKLLVIEFTAAWCGPCRHMELPMKSFAAKYTDVQFIKIDVDELAFVARQFDACTLPAFCLVKKGNEVDRVTGVKKSELQYKIEKHRA